MLTARVLARLLRELRDLRGQNPTARISAIAHSFGTYALTKALEEPDIRLHRVIFCGCIVKDTFRRARHEAQPGKDPILNDCGTHDILPVLAILSVIPLRWLLPLLIGGGSLFALLKLLSRI